MGMGGRGQFVLREFYDPFLAHGLDILPKKFNFIDVGCSRGFFTLFLLATNSSDAKGICIDPFDYALADLSEVLKLNKFENIQIIKGVVSDKTSDKIFVHNIEVPSEASVIKKESHENKKGFYCKSYTIDELIYSMNLIKSIEFIKIDAESAELEILKGSIKTLKQMKPIIYLEITKNEKEIRELLLENQYTFFHFKYFFGFFCLCFLKCIFKSNSFHLSIHILIISDGGKTCHLSLYIIITIYLFYSKHIITIYY